MEYSTNQIGQKSNFLFFGYERNQNWMEYSTREERIKNSYLTLCPMGKFSCLFLLSADFFQNYEHKLSGQIVPRSGWMFCPRSGSNKFAKVISRRHSVDKELILNKP